MSKQKTQLKGKRLTAMVASIAMVAATALSLGAATYAWFTRGTSASAEGFDFTASAAQGIQISTTGLENTWKSNITAVDFNGLFAAGQPQAGNNITLEGMDPISTSGIPVNGNLAFFGAEVDDDNYVVETNTDDFLMFDLYFLNESSALNLRLDIDSLVGNTDELETALSTRVAFIKQGVDTIANAEGGSLHSVRNGGEDDVYIWEPNSYTRSNMAANSKGAQDNVKYSYEGLNAVPVEGAIERDGYGYIRQGTHTTTVATNDIAMGETDIITNLAANSVTKITVYLWMEGQDIDNDNSVSSGNVEMSLKFEAALDSVAGVTPVSVSGNELTVDSGAGATAGATYTAYVLQTGLDAEGESEGVNTYNYIRLVTQGEITIAAGQEGLTTITLDSSFAAAEYTVVIVGRLTDKATSIVSVVVGE